MYLFAAIPRGDKLGGGDSGPPRVSLLLVVVYHPAVVDFGVLRGGKPGSKSDSFRCQHYEGNVNVSDRTYPKAPQFALIPRSQSIAGPI